jgi:hypothetical protein
LWLRALTRLAENSGGQRCTPSLERTQEKGAKELLDVLEKNKGEVERLIRTVKGFVSFSLVRSAEGGFSVSVFNDTAGTDESIRVARDWIAKNAANTGVSPPKISEGAVILQVS